MLHIIYRYYFYKYQLKKWYTMLKQTVTISYIKSVYSLLSKQAVNCSIQQILVIKQLELQFESCNTTSN